MMQIVPIDVFPLIDRAKMPQIDLNVYPDMLIFLGNKGLTFNAGYIDPKSLKLHQEIDVERAKALPETVLRKPILIAIEGYVLDGDHRGFRHYLDNTLAPYIQINATFQQAIELLLEFPATYEVASDN